jgi:hypothetical protein
VTPSSASSDAQAVGSTPFFGEVPRFPLLEPQPEMLVSTLFSLMELKT